MTPERFRAAMDICGWSASWLAKLAGYHPGAGRAWQSGQNPVPVGVAIWLEHHANHMTTNPPPQRANKIKPRLALT